MIKKIIAGLLLTASTLAFADTDIHLTWGKSLAREDGSALLSADINGYYIRHWDNNIRVDDIFVAGADVLTYTVPLVTEGVVHMFEIATVADGGTKGAYSDPIGLYIPEEVTPEPAAPITFKVEVSCIGCVQ